MSRRVLATALAIAVAGPLAGVAASPGGMITNPLLPSGPDPFILTDGGWFYYTATQGDRIALRRTHDLGALAGAEAVTVWRPPATGPNAVSIWAPELHKLDGRWFLYYSAAASGHDDDGHRAVFVLENDGADPLKGRWIDRGRIAAPRPGIDGTVTLWNGRIWFAYSAYDGPDSVLMIAPMSDPWTLAAAPVAIARPDQPWERRGGRQILEGPAFLTGPGGDLFLSYSGSACWSDDYAIGMLRLRHGSDPMLAASWSKQPGPAMAKSEAADVYAPGHNGFFTAEHGRRTWIVYHANRGAGAGCSPSRSPRVQPVAWSREGVPELPAPIPVGQPLRSPRP